MVLTRFVLPAVGVVPSQHKSPARPFGGGGGGPHEIFYAVTFRARGC